MYGLLQISRLTNNLLSFQLVPTNTNGTTAFSVVSLPMQMYTYNQHMEGYEAAGGPNDELAVHIRDFQMECIQLTDAELRKGWILANAGGQGKKLKVAMRKIDSIRYIQGRCGLLTDT